MTEEGESDLGRFMTAQMAARFCRVCLAYNKKAEEADMEDDESRVITASQGFYNMRDAATTKALAAAERQRRAFEAEGKKEQADCMHRALNACEFCDGRKPYLADVIAESRL